MNGGAGGLGAGRASDLTIYRQQLARQTLSLIQSFRLPAAGLT
jgi:hypothetical protein